MSGGGIDPNTIIAAASAVLVAVTGLMAEGMRRHAKSQKASMHVVKEQVQNSHSTNLRDDLDKVAELVQSVLDNQGRTHSDLTQIRTDLGTERTERLYLAGRIEGLITAQQASVQQAQLQVPPPQA